MNRNITRLLPVLISSVLVASCGNKKEEEAKKNAPPPPVSVAVYKVDEEPVVALDTYPGTVVPLNEVEIRAEVNGYLTDIYVKDGQRVTKGQKLYAIDRTRYAAAYNQAQAQLQVAQTNYARVAKDAQRYNRLAQQDAIALQQVDVANANAANAASQIAAARAAVSSVALDLRHSVLTAPLSGTIGITQVRLGGLVSQGTTLINTISSESPIAVDVSIAEQDIPRFAKLQQNAGIHRDSLFTLVLPGNQEYKQAGKIVTIDRAVDPQTGTLRVRIQFPNPDRMLKAGMNCTLRVLNSDTGNQLTIPFKAVTEQMGEYFVYVLGDSSKVAQRKVALGTRVKDKVVVRQGLKENETIVSEGIQNLREGAAVRVGDPNQPAAAPQEGKPTAAK
ncbi:efflux RND transporter periplasmic adaptor subunit [Hymenobacter sp. BT491]|uniref:efflux RND transporter periplasmic adaptor subunit n=1 Tax=Hymenobacter sp. BT491 TaxID=2766779 RepID=UPI001653677C|nr:efflux RND transporter periplasmic adaptor subunit [Hymenobacter sp. BT491]MBC6989690.1 efflux RND transporter periplasmic adaptor subunit [Hymenobacter sp. BT491]